MGTNVEIKARLAEPARTRRLAEGLADREPEVLVQDDTFFPASTGRLKLRKLSERHGELIVYRRPDRPGPKASEYSLVETDRPDELRAILAAALGVEGRVRKTRRLILHGQTRIHLDEVEGLGHFLELEVVLREDQSAGDGERVARDLMSRLEIPDDALVPVAYRDLLATAE